MPEIIPYACFFLLVIIAGAILGYLRYRAAKAKILDKNSARLKRIGISVLIDLLSCEIKHRQTYEETADGIKVLKDLSILIYSTTINDVEAEFRSPVIYLSKDKLLRRLTIQKNTLLYIDPSNSANYYFDLAFLIEFII